MEGASDRAPSRAMTIDRRTVGGDNAFPSRTGGRAAEGTGLLNRPDAEAPIRETTDDTARSGDDDPTRAEALVAVLALNPELAEVVGAWKILDEPIRDAILHLIRAKNR